MLSSDHSTTSTLTPLWDEGLEVEVSAMATCQRHSVSASKECFNDLALSTGDMAAVLVMATCVGLLLSLAIVFWVHYKWA